jgi:hypothetical protein
MSLSNFIRVLQAVSFWYLTGSRYISSEEPPKMWSHKMVKKGPTYYVYCYKYVRR